MIKIRIVFRLHKITIRLQLALLSLFPHWGLVVVRNIMEMAKFTKNSAKMNDSFLLIIDLNKQKSSKILTLSKEAQVKTSALWT